MDIIIGILAFIFALGLIICIHEGGHFLFARRAKILCREFAFGMGPQLIKKKKGETVYALRLLPIGGFCAIAGEEEENDPLVETKDVKILLEEGIIKKIYLNIDNDLFDDLPTVTILEYDLFDKEETGNLFIRCKYKEANASIEAMNEEVTYPVDPQAMFVFTKAIPATKENLPKEKKQKKYTTEYQIVPYNRTLNSKSKGARALVMFGGPLMNFILALVAFFFSCWLTGYSDMKSTTLYDTPKESPAYIAGLRDGDSLQTLSASKKDHTTYTVKVNSWNDVSIFMEEYRTDEDIVGKITVTYLRDSTTHIAQVSPQTIIYSISMVEDITQEGIIIGPLAEASKAYKAGLREGQEILAIDGVTMTSWKDVYHAFQRNVEGKAMTLKVREKEEMKEINVTPYSKELFDKTQSVDIVTMIMGISPTIKHSFFKSFPDAGKMMGSSVVSMVNTLGMLFTSKEVGVDDLSGPVGIFSIVKEAAKSGFATLLYWIGFLSVNVGLLNLLPIPALDGGRLVFLGYEAITKKEPSQKVQTALITVTFLLLIGLMIYVSFNDILRLIGVK